MYLKYHNSRIFNQAIIHNVSNNHCKKLILTHYNSSIYKQGEGRNYTSNIIRFKIDFTCVRLMKWPFMLFCKVQLIMMEK